MRRCGFAVFALICFAASGFAAAYGYTETAIFERLFQEKTRLPEIGAGPESTVSTHWESQDLEIGSASNGSANLLNRDSSVAEGRRAFPNVAAIRGKKAGDHFPYGLVLVATPLKDAREGGGEAAELTTTLMIGIGLISVGLFRRFYRVA